MKPGAALPSLPLLALILVSVVLVCVHAKTKDYYQILGVDKTASDRDIKKAYRKRAQKVHPDKHPDKAQEFMEVSDAYQTLSDSELRKIYDRYGEEGVKKHQQNGNQGGGGNDPFDMFRSFFGGGGPFQRGPPKGPNKGFNVELPLADIYNGKTFNIEFDRSVICNQCDGSGARHKSDIHQCDLCGGRGVRVVRQQIMPGFVTNAQVQCDRCEGKGTVIAHACEKCKGAKTIVENASVEVEVERGAEEGEQIIYEGESDEGPDFEAGDVIVHLYSEKAKGDFRRRGSNLYLTLPIGLDDALLGFERNVTHFDGRAVLLRRAAVTQPGFVQVIAGEGMPRRNQESNGNLYVEYEIVMPDKIEGDLRKAMEKIFGRKAVIGDRPNDKAEHQEL